MPAPCTVGLTGGLASGKSTVARRLIEIGAAVLDADAVVHGLYRSGGSGAETVRRLFGEAVLQASGAVDRTALGQRVLDDPAALERLNRAVHPLVRDEVRVWLARVSGPVAVVEAALLVETGAYRSYDVLAVVWCKPEQQLQRAVNRGIDEQRARKILAAQLPMVEKRSRADIVIDNSGAPAQLSAEVERAWAEIQARCTQLTGDRCRPTTRSDSSS